MGGWWRLFIGMRLKSTCVGDGRHIHPNVQRIHVLGSHHGLAQPARALVEAIQHPGSRLLRGCLGGALSMGVPGIFNTDQGSQFTSEAFTSVLLNRGVQISRDSAGAYVGNVFVERLEEREARGGVPKGMRECGRGQSRDWSLPELLQ